MTFCFKVLCLNWVNCIMLSRQCEFSLNSQNQMLNLAVNSYLLQGAPFNLTRKVSKKEELGLSTRLQKQLWNLCRLLRN